MQILSTRNVDPVALARVQDRLRLIEGVEIECRPPFLRKSAEETPEFVRIIADLATWSTVLKVVAIAFLAKLGALTAEDIWKSKAKIASALSEHGSELLKGIADSLYQVKRSSHKKTAIEFAIPIPSDFHGTRLTCPAESEEEIAVYLACFAMRAADIGEVIAAFAAKYENPSISVSLELLNNGTFRVTMTEIMSGDQHSEEI